MSLISKYFESDFLGELSQWENSLKSELKLTEIGTRALKKNLDGSTWPTLSLKAAVTTHLGAQESWKKASVTYANLPKDKVSSWIAEDLKTGVRNFFFFGDLIAEGELREALDVLGKSTAAKEVEVFLLGEGTRNLPGYPFPVVSGILRGSAAHDGGGHSSLELAELAVKLARAPEEDFFLGVYVDSQFFNNIAKIRAAKLLARRILDLRGSKARFKVVALTSYGDWTLFERYSNILRNETAVAAAYIAGADHVQSSGYNVLFDLETDAKVDEHTDRSRRMARNTSHVLALESMLGTVTDAAHGSFHLENLTQHLCESAWKKFQELVALDAATLRTTIDAEAATVRAKRLELVKTRKHVQAGMNDYPDVSEVLNLKVSPRHKVFRAASAFEDLRLKVEGLGKKPEVQVALFGEYGALNARLNFVKNYFELLGLRVHDPGHSVTDLEEFHRSLTGKPDAILVLCALDEQYPSVLPLAAGLKNQNKFIAGKVEAPGFTNLFAGQNVFDVLSALVARWGNK